MTDGELRILAIVDQKVDALRVDIRDMRNELLTHFMRHDASDNERFAELFQRVKPLEITQAVQQDRESNEQREEQQDHGWATTRLMAVSALAGGLISRIPDLLIWLTKVV